MNTITIKWLSDSADCNHAGCSGGYSEGVIVTMNGEPWIELIPTASCFGGDNWSESDVYRIIFKKLGYELNN